MLPFIRDKFINFICDKCRTRIYINTFYSCRTSWLDKMICMPSLSLLLLLLSLSSTGNDTERHPELTRNWNLQIHRNRYRYKYIYTDVEMQQNSIQKQQLIPNNVKYYLFLTEVINVVVVVVVIVVVVVVDDYNVAPSQRFSSLSLLSSLLSILSCSQIRVVLISS